MNSVNRIAIIDQMILEQPDLRDLLELRKMILQAQKSIRETSTKGTTINWDDQSIIEGFKRKAQTSKMPLISSISTSTFDVDKLLQMCEQIVNVLIKKEVGKEELIMFIGELKCGKLKLSELIDAAIREDADFYEKLNGRFGVKASLLLFIVDMLIQPCLEEIAKKTGSSFLNEWRKSSCPVCGRRPVVAWIKEHKRYLACTLCGAEYLADLFLCVNCGNIDPPTLRFLTPNNYPAFRVDFCDKCKHYVKVIYKDRIRTPIPKGLEDIMTVNLDFIAEKVGLIRV